MSDWLYHDTRNHERRLIWRERIHTIKHWGFPIGIAVGIVALYLAGKL